jgi:hypothetical protein
MNVIVKVNLYMYVLDAAPSCDGGDVIFTRYQLPIFLCDCVRNPGCDIAH